MDRQSPEPSADVALRAEVLRSRYRPNPVKVLFVGESAPAGGRFFYAGNSSAFREFQRVLDPALDGPGVFLERFRDAGLYLDDLVQAPVNQLEPIERKARNTAAVPALAARMAECRPCLIVGFAKKITVQLAQAHALSGVDCPRHIVSFPGNGQQANFRRELAEILPHILAISRA